MHRLFFYCLFCVERLYLCVREEIAAHRGTCLYLGFPMNLHAGMAYRLVQEQLTGDDMHLVPSFVVNAAWPA